MEKTLLKMRQSFYPVRYADPIVKMSKQGSRIRN